MMYDAVLLASFGGPEAPEEVMPFLRRVTAGRGVPDERLSEVAEHYYALGGVSPINEQNRSLVAALRTALTAVGESTPLYWGNRNSPPYFADTLREIHSDGHRRVVALATSAYSSYSGCRQYRDNFVAALDEAQLVDVLSVDKLGPFHTLPGFIEPFAQGLDVALDELTSQGHQNVEVLFVTHSIPTAMAQASGPAHQPAPSRSLYESQHLAVAGEIMRNRRQPWHLTYQSRSGPPTVPWLEPDINKTIDDAARRGVGGVVVVPIGFVSDHVEVVWDLDHEARETALGVGLAFRRVGTPGVAPAFVSGLVQLIQTALSEGVKTLPLCAVDCCLNAIAGRSGKQEILGEAARLRDS